MCAKKTKYLSYIEETRKHHPIIDAIAGESSRIAIKKSLAASVPVTYLEGEAIVEVDSNGKKKIVGTVENNRRKVTVGARSVLRQK